MAKFLVAVAATLLFQGGWLLRTCHAQNSGSTTREWTGCVSQNNPSEVVAIGQPTTICFVAGNGVNWASGVTYLRFSFRPNADEYSRFHIPGSYADLIKNRVSDLSGGNITVHTESQLQLSFQRLYFDNRTSLVYPFLTAIINVKRGVVQGITWDNACLFCSKSECDEITYDYNGNVNTQGQIGQPTKGCAYTKDYCDGVLANNGIECDLILYVVWTGTDKSGNVLQSSANRYSAFPAQKLQNRISQNLPSFPGFRDL